MEYDATVDLVVAHPDDESLGAGLLLQRIRKTHVIFCASGAALWPPYWLTHGSPWERSHTRIREASRAIAHVENIHSVDFLGHPDGWLVTHLQDAHRSLSKLLMLHKPDYLVTHAFEGGHEDHDACSFLARQLFREHGIPVWEMPLYYREPGSQLIVRQCFASRASEEEVITPASDIELDTKLKMLSEHLTQQDVIRQFDPTVERFRIQPEHDYVGGPHNALPSRMIGFSPRRATRAFQKWDSKNMASEQ